VGEISRGLSGSLLIQKIYGDSEKAKDLEFVEQIIQSFHAVFIRVELRRVKKFEREKLEKAGK
jgi:hypothetical protein